MFIRAQIVLGLAVAATLAACTKEAPPATPPTPTAAPAASASPAPTRASGVTPEMLAMFRRSAPPAEVQPAAPELVTLGRMLFFETRLSKNHDLSCNSCHDLRTYGVDGEQFSTGHKGQKGGRNAPTVYNAAEHIAQFWDGRAKDLAEQAAGPMMNPVEMAMPSEKLVVATLKSIPEYVKLFEAAYPGVSNPVSLANAARAIAAFEKNLVTPSRFDRLLAGDASALSDAETRGLRVFVTNGCVACHSGPNLGGTMFQKVGLVKPWPNLSDEGRYTVTRQEADRHVFRTPTLRNVAKTGPWFHDGAVGDLNEAVKLMADRQLGRSLTEVEVKDLVAFLNALTGELPEDYIAAPALPPSTARTPPPDPS